jgi:hypothetical protein
MQALHATQWMTATSSTLACVSSSAVECTPAEEYKNWILHKNAVPPIVEMINSFKEYWSNVIALVNQTAVPALQHGYGMTAVDIGTSVASYGDLLTNFGAAYATTQETMKSQANSLVAMQNQLANIQQFCIMAIGQQPPSSVYAPAQQQRTFNNCNKCNSGGQTAAVLSHNNQP